MIEIDGSEGEGGGQVLRTSLALSVITRTPFKLLNIRAGREQPGLKKQHLACVHAAAQISAARVIGDRLGSSELTFEPVSIKSGDFEFDIGSAGSTCLLFQTILYPLLFARGASTVRVRGGTHNPWAPPYHFLLRTLLPQLTKMNVAASLQLMQYGFYPGGGGVIFSRISSWTKQKQLELLKLGSEIDWSAEAVSAGLPDHVGDRELEVCSQRFPVPREFTEVHYTSEYRKAECRTVRSGNYRVQASGKGNAVMLYASTDDTTETFTAIGRVGLPAERVAQIACDEADRWLRANVPVGEHLADQLLLPVALGAGGRFRTMKPTQHTLTNIATIGRFIDTPITVTEQDGAWLVSVG